MTTAAKEALKNILHYAQDNELTYIQGQALAALSAITHPTAPEVEEAIADIKNNVLGRGCVSEYSENSIETLITAATQKGK